VPRADRRLTVKDWVCSDHFHDIDIIRYFEDITVGDLVIKGEKRSKPILRDGAVPSIFNGPAYLNKPTRKRKAPRDRSEPQEKISRTEDIAITEEIDQVRLKNKRSLLKINIFLD